MKISFKGDYALKTLLELAVQEGKLASISDISKRRDIPFKYLEQIMIVLKGAGYVTSKRGPTGGYLLSKPAKNIKLGEIIRLMEGPTSPITCVSTSCYTRCSDEKNCPFRETWFQVKNAINNIVDRTTIEDIAKKERLITKKEATNYEI